VGKSDKEQGKVAGLYFWKAITREDDMRRVVLILFVVGLLAGCASDPFRIPQATAGKVCTPIKETTGGSSGMLLLGFAPIARNGMVERAYKEAIELGGGDVLLNPVYEDRWAWTPVGNLFFITVKGTVAKCN
jgi:hypothetical protein